MALLRECGSLQRPEVSTLSGAKVIGDFKLPNVGLGTQLQSC